MSGPGEDSVCIIWSVPQKRAHLLPKEINVRVLRQTAKTLLLLWATSPGTECKIGKLSRARGKELSAHGQTWKWEAAVNYKSHLVVCVYIDLLGSRVSTCTEFTYNCTHRDPLITLPGPGWSHLSALLCYLKLSLYPERGWKGEERKCMWWRKKTEQASIKNAWRISEQTGEHRCRMKRQETDTARTRRCLYSGDCFQRAHEVALAIVLYVILGQWWGELPFRCSLSCIHN